MNFKSNRARNNFGEQETVETLTLVLCADIESCEAWEELKISRSDEYENLVVKVKVDFLLILWNK